MNKSSLLVLGITLGFVGLSQAKHYLIETEGKPEPQKEEAGLTGYGDNHATGCPIILECTREGEGNCVIQTPYGKQYLIKGDLEYEDGRIQCVCRMYRKTNKNMCGIRIKSLEKKDVGDWRCGVEGHFLNTLTVTETNRHCKNKALTTHVLEGVADNQAIGCPIILECTKEADGNCMMKTPYGKEYLIKDNRDYENGRLHCICRLNRKTNKEMCGMMIKSLEEKDIGDWRCGVAGHPLKTLTVTKNNKECANIDVASSDYFEGCE